MHTHTRAFHFAATATEPQHSRINTSKHQQKHGASHGASHGAIPITTSSSGRLLTHEGAGKMKAHVASCAHRALTHSLSNTLHHMPAVHEHLNTVNATNPVPHTLQNTHAGEGHTLLSRCGRHIDTKHTIRGWTRMQAAALLLACYCKLPS